MPGILSGDFAALSAAVEWSLPSTDIEIKNSEPLHSHVPKFDAAGRQVGPWVSISNIERVIQDHAMELTIEEEVTECFHLLQSQWDSPF